LARSPAATELDPEEGRKGWGLRRPEEKPQAGTLIIIDALTASDVKTKTGSRACDIGVTGKAIWSTRARRKAAMSVRNIAGVSCCRATA
jgi:hypothetical protein